MHTLTPYFDNQNLDSSITDSNGNTISNGNSTAGSGYRSCCEYPESIKNNFEGELQMIVYCDGSLPRVRFRADLIIRKNPLTCNGANLSASLNFGGKSYKFTPWITKNTTLIQTQEIILSPEELDLILKSAEKSGGKSRVSVTIHGILNVNISDQCTNEQLRNNRVSFNPDVKIRFVSWNESVSSYDEISGPHCVGDTNSCEGGQNSQKCPAKCCECCESVGQLLFNNNALTPTKILVYSKNDGSFIFRKEDNPCPDRTPVNTIIDKQLYTCPYDCECSNDQKDQPTLSGTGIKLKLPCERGKQTCYQCVLKEEGDCDYNYTAFLSNSLPLSLEDLISQNLTN